MTIKMSRPQLAQFLPDPDAIRKFEDLFLDVYQTLPATFEALIQEVRLEAGSNSATLASIDAVILGHTQSLITPPVTTYTPDDPTPPASTYAPDAPITPPMQLTLGEMADVKQTSIVAGSVLIWNTTARRWQNGVITGSGVTVTNGDGSIALTVTGAPPTGTAGGVLGGTYPNPGFASTTGTGAVVLATAPTIVAPLNVSGTAGSLTQLAVFATPSMSANQKCYIELGQSTASSEGFYFAYNHNTTAASRYVSIQDNAYTAGGASSVVLYSGGALACPHLIGNTGTPTIVAGTGAGTTPTVSVVGNDTAMQVTVTTGTLPTGAGATVATITYNVAYASTPHPVFSPANAAAGLLTGASGVTMDGASASTYTIIVETTALIASTTYKWNVHTIA